MVPTQTLRCINWNKVLFTTTLTEYGTCSKSVFVPHAPHISPPWVSKGGLAWDFRENWSSYSAISLHDSVVLKIVKPRTMGPSKWLFVKTKNPIFMSINTGHRMFSHNIVFVVEPRSKVLFESESIWYYSASPASVTVKSLQLMWRYRRMPRFHLRVLNHHNDFREWTKL